jgi:PHD/YefM family antitoxin component YafN of YafNO toxin-antitoxin module
MREVAATEFTRNVGQYRDIARREPVAVTAHGRATGYFISAIEYEAFQRLKSPRRQRRAGGDMTKADIDQIAASRMSTEHDFLNALLDGDSDS